MAKDLDMAWWDSSYFFAGRSLDKLLQDEEDKFDEDFMLKFDGLHKERLPEGRKQERLRQIC